MDASSSNKRIRLGEGGDVAEDCYKGILKYVKHVMSEQETAYNLDLAFHERKAERSLLQKLMKPDCNFDKEQISLIQKNMSDQVDFYDMDMKLYRQKAKRRLLQKIVKEEFNLADEYRMVSAELEKADVEVKRNPFKQNPIDWDKLEFKTSKETEVDDDDEDDEDLGLN